MAKTLTLHIASLRNNQCTVKTVRHILWVCSESGTYIFRYHNWLTGWLTNIIWIRILFLISSSPPPPSPKPCKMETDPVSETCSVLYVWNTVQQVGYSMAIWGLFLALPRDPSPKHSDWLCGPPSILFKGYQGFPGERGGKTVVKA